MRYAIVKQGESSSFPETDVFHATASSPNDAEVMIYCGVDHKDDPGKQAVLIELGNECLGEHTGESNGDEGSNIVGFARYRNGSDEPSKLVELVKQPRTLATALTAARSVFESAGLEVVISSDQAGRIINRLVYPKYNAALRFLDEGLATQRDMDLTCKLGLGYPDGPIERVTRGGLDNYYEVSKALFDVFGTSAYVPARRAAVAFNRSKRSK
jgi:3-hydroxybutyryl-CoA dehydrogenase